MVTLKALKKQLEEAVAAEEGDTEAFNRDAMDDLLKRRMFLIKSFEIYGGVAGFFDFGPPGCALKSNLLSLWKRHFVLNEGMLEIECTNLTAEEVLQTSGHVERFTDLMVKDTKTGECYRADKLLEDHIEDLLAKNPAMPEAERQEHERTFRQADAFTPAELGTAHEVRDQGDGTATICPSLPLQPDVQDHDWTRGHTRGVFEARDGTGHLLEL